MSVRSCHTDVSDRGYTSDSELYENQSKHQPESTELQLRPIPDNGSWMLVSVSLAQMFLDALHVVVFQLFMVLEQYE